jgi:hypothetical protein
MSFFRRGRVRCLSEATRTALTEGGAFAEPAPIRRFWPVLEAGKVPGTEDRYSIAGKAMIK